MKRFLSWFLLSVCTIALISFGFLVRAQDAPTSSKSLNSELPKYVENDNPETVQESAWRTFLALNWPADTNGNPMKGDGTNTLLEKFFDDTKNNPRVWEFYCNPDQIFTPNPSKNLPKDKYLCLNSNTDPSPYKLILIADQGYPLIDQSGNYILYNIRMNPSMASQIIQNGWNANAPRTQDPKISFKKVTIRDNEIYPLEIKTAWRINPPNDSYYTVTRDVRITDAQIDQNSSIVVKQLKLGLIGFHIAYKIPIVGQLPCNSRTGCESNKYLPQWIWATFEHKDNAPDKPIKSDKAQYTLFDSKSKIECGSEPGSKDSKCNTSQVKKPFYFKIGDSLRAVDESGNPLPKTQVVREGNLATTSTTWPPETLSPQERNQAENLIKDLEGTVWANYQMRGNGVLWQSQPFNDTPMANAAIETYVPKNDQSCFQCHSKAKFFNKDWFSDFSFQFYNRPSN